MNNLGEIYCVTSPSGKKYIGQCVKELIGGKKWGYISRWKEHIRDSKTRNYCRLLNNAINKYQPENFLVELILECNIDQLDDYERHYINLYNTLTPNGYNLTSGGSICRQSEETRQLKKESMIGKNKGKIYPTRVRKNEEDNNLPKYIRHYRDSNEKEGYRISSHPTIKSKSFLSKTKTMEEKLALAIEYLNTNNFVTQADKS